MERQIAAVVIALNEEEYIEYALRSIYDFCKWIIVIEGAVELMRCYANSDGSSTDKTVEILKSFPDPKGRIILEQGLWKDKMAQRQCYLDIIASKRLNPDYLLQVDGDEVYPYQTLVELKRLLHSGKIELFSFPFYHFWTSFRWRARGSIWDIPQLRCLKYSPDLRFVDSHIYPSNKYGEKVTQNNARYRHYVMRQPIFHYSYVKPPSKIHQKLDFYQSRDGSRLKVVDNWTPWRRGLPTSCTHANVPTTAEEFEGPHPEVMFNHPYRFIDDIRKVRE